MRDDAHEPALLALISLNFRHLAHQGCSLIGSKALRRSLSSQALPELSNHP